MAAARRIYVGDETKTDATFDAMLSLPNQAHHTRSCFCQDTRKLFASVWYSSRRSCNLHGLAQFRRGKSAQLQSPLPSCYTGYIRLSVTSAFRRERCRPDRHRLILGSRCRPRGFQRLRLCLTSAFCRIAVSCAHNWHPVGFSPGASASSKDFALLAHFRRRLVIAMFLFRQILLN